MGDVLEGTFKRLTASILETVIQTQILDALFKDMEGPNLGGGGSLMSLFGNIFGGFRADGGPTEAGKSYIVGERGPEMFTPRTGGMIIPNEALQGQNTGSRSVINIDARGSTDPAEVERAAYRGALAAAPQIRDFTLASAGRPPLPGGLGRGTG